MISFCRRSPEKEALSERLARDSAAFEAAGGAIRRCPPDKRGAPDMAAPHRWDSDGMKFASPRTIRR